MSKKDKRSVCIDCGTAGKPKRVAPGSIVVEIGLWILLLVPGLIYSLWRVSSKYDACPACGSKHLVPASSPVGQRALAAA